MKKLSLSFVLLLFLPLFAFAGTDPADYPIKVHVLEQNWLSHNVPRSEFKGNGRGNISEGDTVRAFDFKYDCFFGLQRTARNHPYLAKWKKAQRRLDLLAEKIGKEGKYQHCELETTVHDGVYMMGVGGLTEITQQDFKLWKSNRDAAMKAQQASGAPRLARSKVSVASTPASADIEIDGEFMGNTPSELELDPGEHTVSVSKAGYKTWQKKLKSAAGAITLNAELEPEPKK